MVRLGVVAAVVGLVAWATLVAAAVDYYAQLGVSRSASTEEIKRAYKKLAMQNHPDRFSGDEKKQAETRFMEIGNAYEVLSDPDKKRVYDQYGEEGLRQGAGGGGPQFTNPFDLFRTFGGGGGGAFNIEFGPGGATMHPGGGGGQQRKMADTPVPLDVTLEELYTGANVEIAVDRQTICHHCDGTGGEGGATTTCPKCGGRGVVIEQTRIAMGVMQVQKQCDQCHGSGKTIAHKCPHCDGKGTVHGEDRLVVQVEPGMKHDDEIPFEEMGDAAPDATAGRVVVKINQLPHARFTRKGDTLTYRASISLLQALVGFTLPIRHLDGHVVNVTRNEVTPYGEVVILANEGMPLKDHPSVHGELHVIFHIKFPKALSEAQRADIKKVLTDVE